MAIGHNLISITSWSEAKSIPHARELLLRAPVIVGVLAATAIPIEIGSFGSVPIHLGWSLVDAIANVVGYAPVGIVLAPIGAARATLVALLMSVATEALQLGMVHRDPSVADVVSNVAGALVGIGCAVAWRIGTASVTVNRRSALGVALLGLFVVGRAWAAAGPPLNPRGVTEPGTLEAHWKLDEDSGRIARDSSGHGLDAEFPREPARFPGISGRAPRFNGTSDEYADAGRDTAFRLVGSMTIAAWINAASFPVDDAVIVSTLEHIDDIGFGWQLDTTVDRGPRVIGFKLAGECGTLMSRYGATPLQPNAWYHVAAVYDAASRTMHVYLNGKLDDGDLGGTVEDNHRSSRRTLLIGKRGDLSGFEFSGLISSVRLYSSALAPSDVAGLTRAAQSDPARPLAPASAHQPSIGTGRSRVCGWTSEPQDGRLPALVVVVGMSVAFVCASVLTRFTLVALGASTLVGVVMFFLSTPTLPAVNLWTFPITSLAGGLSVIASLREIYDR